MTKKTIGKGKELGGLYVFDSLPSTIVACTSINQALKTHCQLGHPSLSNFKILCPQYTSIKSLECDSCQFAKHHRQSSSPRINKRAASAFDLVHSDIWGPSSVTSKLGFKYFVMFVDDYSRLTWMFLMKNRSELYSMFRNFCVEIKTQFGTTIKTLRSDNAKEYTSSLFHTFMNDNGIMHETSCVDTASQNGIAERKIDIF